MTPKKSDGPILTVDETQEYSDFLIRRSTHSHNKEECRTRRAVGIGAFALFLMMKCCLRALDILQQLILTNDLHSFDARSILRLLPNDEFKEWMSEELATELKPAG